VLDTLNLPEGQQFGANIVKAAVEAPLRQIVSNAGGEPSIVLENVRNGEGGYGYNARQDTYEDLIAAGIIDPTKVTRCALQNAASVAGLLLTTEAMVADHTEEEGHEGHMH
jgi:chaperonin GroEL